MNIDIKDLKKIQPQLAQLKDDVLFIEKEGNAKYVIMPIDMFDEIEGFIDVINNKDSRPLVKIANPSELQLTYEEYESIKKQIIEAVDKTFKPNPEKLN